MRKFLLSAVIPIGLAAGTAVTAPAFAAPSAHAMRAGPSSNVQLADYYWHHHYYHHRRWDHDHHQWDYYN